MPEPESDADLPPTQITPAPKPAPHDGVRDTDALLDAQAARAMGMAARRTGPEMWEPPTPEALQALMPGYIIDKLLGRGGMGAVYHGIQIRLDRPVAIKILPPGLEERDPAFTERFKNEARLMAKLVHPDIVTVFDSGQTVEGQLYFVMEFVDGMDVAGLIFKNGWLPQEQACTIAKHVCQALKAAHELGIIHRDIKPANVIINPKGQVKVADFGLARVHDDAAHLGLTRTGFAVGTPDYLAPEAYVEGVKPDARMDLFALGVMLYQMLTGTLPRGAYKPATVMVPGIEPRFDAIIARAMQVNREERYQTAAEMHHDLCLITFKPAGLPVMRQTSLTAMAVPVAGGAGAESPPANVPPPASTPSPRSQAPTRAAPSSQTLGKAGKSTQVPRRRFAGREWNAESLTRLVTAALAVLFCFVAGYLCLNKLGSGLVLLSYDLPFVSHRSASAKDVRIIFLDELNGERLDRRVQAPLLDKLRQAGARGVVYDLIFDQPWTDKTVDTAFADAIRRFRGVDADGKPLPGATHGIVMLACGREQFSQTGVTGEKLLPPTDELLAAADDFGLVALKRDENFTVRELTNGTPDEPSVTWKAAVALGAKLDEARRLDPLWINYVGPPPRREVDSDHPDAVPAIPSFPASVVLEDADPALFRDKIVVIGGRPGIVSPKLGEDLFATPFHRVDFLGHLPLMSGVEVQANILINLLNGTWLSRSSHGMDLLLLLVVALAAGIGLSRVKPLSGFLLVLASMALLALAGWAAMHFEQVWFPWSVAAFVQLPLALVGSTAAHFYVERFFRLKLDKEQEKLREAFAKYLSPRMLERLTAEGFQLAPGGDRVHAAMMFTDIESFTEMCQRVRDPERIVENLNGYFERTTGHVFDHDGIVIKFIGDAIFAAWGVPFEDDAAPVKAVRAAWKLYENAKLIVGGDELHTRVGLHFGEVVAGNIGSTRHIDYTLIGDAVNLASRLEGLNKALGTNILLSGSVHAHLGDEFCTRRVGQFRVKGRQDVTTVYELLGPASQTELPQWALTYHSALEAFEKGDPFKARKIFEETDQSRRQGDGPSQFFLNFISSGEKSAAGVVELKEK